MSEQIHDPLGSLRAQIGELSQNEAARVTAGHLDLSSDLWLSTDPAGRGKLSCEPAGETVILRLEGGDSGAWAALGMRLPLEALKQARYLGLLIRLAGGDAFSCTPILRYYLPDGMRDVPAGAPVILAGGPREHLSYIRLDAHELERATSCELNLFFHTDRFGAEFSALEPLLMF